MTILYLLLGIIVAAFCEFVLGNWRLPLPLIANVVFILPLPTLTEWASLPHFWEE